MSEIAGQFFDFDAWHAEQYGATVPFKILGKTYQLPGDCDAAVLFKMQRLELYAKQVQLATAVAMETGVPAEHVPLPAGLTEEDVAAFTVQGICRMFAGDDIVDEWIAAGIPAKMLAAAGRRLYAIYANQDPDEAIGVGKAPAPTVKAPQDRRPKRPKAKAPTSSNGSSDAGQS